MRHFIGLILGLVLAAALFFGGGWGAEHVSALAGHSVGLPSRTGLIGLAAVLGVGLFMGILIAVPAVSPLATGLPGLVLLGWTALLAVSAHRALGWIPLQSHAFGLGFRVLLLNGMLAPLLGLNLGFRQALMLVLICWIKKQVDSLTIAISRVTPAALAIILYVYYMRTGIKLYG